jgi:uncharacterized protein
MDLTANAVRLLTNELPNLLGIWLFGSVAAGHETRESDVDLAVLSEQELDRVKLWQCAQDIASALNTEVEIVDLHSASTVLRAQIIQSGKRIYTADKYRCDLFETEALSDLLRFNEERAELLEDVRQTGRVFPANG